MSKGGKGIVIILFIIIVWLGVSYLIVINEIKDMVKQIENNKINPSSIRTKSLNKNIENLVKNINSIYDEKEKVIFEKKKVEEEIKSSVANITHDLRTPLTSIMGYIQLLKEKNISIEEREEYIEIIEKRTLILKDLINKFYDLSRLESGDYELEYSNVNLENLLCETIALYYKDFIDKGIEPIVEISNIKNNIISDKVVIQRIFSNLISNMLKYSDGYIKITLSENDDYVLTEFINSSFNIKSEELNKIFQRTFTVDKSRNGSSTGLGLYITKILIEKLGHKINVEKINDNLHIRVFWKK